MIIVTRHKALISYLIKNEIINQDDDINVITHVDDVDIIKGKDVIGVLPMRLSCECNSITEVPLHIPAEVRGRKEELSLEEIEQYAQPLQKYKVTKL